MHDLYTYSGNELQLFQKAKKWKKYFSAFIKPYVKEYVLEVGAGLGTTTFFLNNGSAKEWVLLEPDVSMQAVLEKKIIDHELPANCKVKSGTLLGFDKTPSFDTIIYIDVIEHIKNDKEEIEMALHLLKPGGHIIILSPAFQSLYSPFDKSIGHYRRYNKSQLKKIIPPSLNKIKLKYLDSLGYFLSLTNRWILKQRYPNQKQVHFWDSYLVPVSKILDRISVYSFGKTILGIWKKPID